MREYSTRIIVASMDGVSAPELSANAPTCVKPYAGRQFRPEHVKSAPPGLNAGRAL